MSRHKGYLSYASYLLIWGLKSMSTTGLFWHSWQTSIWLSLFIEMSEYVFPCSSIQIDVHHQIELHQDTQENGHRLGDSSHLWICRIGTISSLLRCDSIYPQKCYWGRCKRPRIFPGAWCPTAGPQFCDQRSPGISECLACTGTIYVPCTEFGETGEFGASSVCGWLWQTCNSRQMELMWRLY